MSILNFLFSFVMMTITFIAAYAAWISGEYVALAIIAILYAAITAPVSKIESK
jgi:hypothetical protein